MSGVISQIEAELIARLTAALTLPLQTHPKVEVSAWPSGARNWRMTHEHGCVLVVYKGSKFDTTGYLQGVTASFEIGVIARSLRQPTLADDAPSGIGIYDLLETCRNALAGHTPQGAVDAIVINTEGFDEYTEGTWNYHITLTVPLAVVIDAPEPQGPYVDVDCGNAPPTTLINAIPS